MSIESMSLALNLVDDRLTPTDKLLLVGIANHDGDGGAWPSMATLARYCGIEVRSVRKRLAFIEELGYVRREVGAGGTSKTPDHSRPTLYHLHLAPPVLGDTPGPTGPPPPVAQDPPPPVPQALRTILEPSLEPSNFLPPDGDRFEQFWTMFRGYSERPGSKGDALCAWQKLGRSAQDAAVQGIVRHGLYIEEYPGRFVMPNGSTWLNKKRWSDETPQEPPQQRTNGHSGIEALRRIRAAEGRS
jgi:hypothetical protein